MAEYAEILEGPDFFDCKRLLCRMLRARCVEMQKPRAYLGHNFPRPGTWVRESCKKCEQGVRIERGEVI